MLLASSPLLSCDTPEQTTRLSVTSELDSALCAGTVPALEVHASSLQTRLGLNAPERIQVLLTDEASDYCDRRVKGCFSVSQGEYYAIGSMHAIVHEINHAIFRHAFNDNRIPGINEGLAEAWTSRGSHLGSFSPLAILAADKPRDVDYRDSAHFIRWLSQTYSPKVLANFIRHIPDTRSSLHERIEATEEALDSDFATLQHTFWASANLYDPGQERCLNAELLEVRATEKSTAQIQLDCDDQNTYGPQVFGKLTHSMFAARTLTIKMAGEYRVWIDSGVFAVVPCDPTDDPAVAARDREMDDIVESGGLGWLLGPRERSQVYALEKGSYALWLGTEGIEAQTITITIEPERPLARVAY